MNKAKNKNPPMPWEVIQNGKGDIHCRIYNQVLKSKAYKTLTPNAKNLYAICKAQEFGRKWFPSGYKLPSNLTEREKRAYFTMNKNKWLDEYGFAKYDGAFYKAMKELIIHGFVDCVYQGKIYKQANVYRLSTRWQQYDNENYEVPVKFMTAQMIAEISKEHYPSDT